MWGSHLIKHWSTTQTVIALSSGEAEPSGITKGASHALGFQSLARDMGLELSLQIFSEARAAIGICRRRGLGNIRHLHVCDLWVQEHLQRGEFALSKVDGRDNPADALTKYIDRPILHKHLPNMSLQLASGRADSVPKLTQ